MRYQKTLNINNLDNDQLSRLQPGKWVTTASADDKSSTGVYLGVRKSGVVVVAWYMNAKAHGLGNFREYVKTLRQYATAN
jgi:hypothetical protein